MSVILCHLSVPGFSGGLVGVDIFFVISGFVITRLLLSGFQTGTLTLTSFYVRRVRRLAPALTLVLLSSFVVAYTWLLPADFEQFSKSLLATSLCISNIFFARQHGDYFAADAAFKPLLHTWSLAVEEQFYLIYPALLFAMLRRGFQKAAIVRIITLVTLASFALACAGIRYFPSYTFFMLPSRAWELMLGALTALAAHPPGFQQVLSILGAILLAAGVTGGHAAATEALPYPLLPCLGTALMIYANSGANTFLKTVLSNPGLVAVGLVSYSLYLWHWPAIVFYRYIIADTLGVADVALILAITIAASVISSIFIEQPIRKKRFLKSLAILSMAAAAAVCCIAVSIMGIATKGYPGRLPPSVVQLAEGGRDVNPARDKCIGKEPENVLSDNFCRAGKPSIEPSFIIWGDSQADAWMPTFNELARQKETAGLFAAHGGCPPLLGIRRVNQIPSHKCTEFNDAVFAKISSFHLRDAILIGRWSWYISGVEKDGVEEGTGALIAEAGTYDEDAAGIATRKRVFRAAVSRTVQRLRDIGTCVWVIDQPPAYQMDVPRYLAYSALHGRAAEGRERAYVQQQHEFQLEVFRENKVDLVDALGFFCPGDSPRCRMSVDGKSLYSDFNHLSAFGTRAFANWASISLF